MMLTQNFTRSELLFSYTGARLGIDNTPHSPQIEGNLKQSALWLQALRDHIKKPIKVLSCYRCPILNHAVGGSKTSAHMQALAVDIVVDGISPRLLAEIIVHQTGFKFDQLIVEFGQWLHVGMPTEHHQRGQVLSATHENGKTVYRNLEV
jgi:hypothetical protein